MTETATNDATRASQRASFIQRATKVSFLYIYFYFSDQCLMAGMHGTDEFMHGMEWNGSSG